MNWRKVTKTLLIVGTLLVIAYDIIPASNGLLGDTISEVVLGWSQRCAFLPLGLGVLVGHLFWPRTGGPVAFAQRHPVLPFGIGIALGLFFKEWSVEWLHHPILAVIAGIVPGHFFWAQDKTPA